MATKETTEAARALRAIPSAKREAQSRANGAKGGRPMYHWAVLDRMTGEIRSRHVYHDDAERKAKGYRYEIIPLNQDKADPGLFRSKPKA